MKITDLSNPIALATIIANSNANSIAVNATGTSYASQEEGFPHITMIPEDNGGEAPHGLDFNGFLKMLSSHVFNIQNGTPETFNAAVSSAIGGYPKNALLWLIDDNNSRLLKSTKDDNTDNFLTTPSVIGTSWVNAIPTQDYVDDTFVTKATAQTITGTKTFTAQPQFAPGYGIRFNTDNGSSEHYVMRSSGNPSVGLSMFLNNDTSKAAFNISPTKITIGSNTILPNSITPSASDDSTRIATTAWVNAVGNNVVHLSGTETITGSKTFTSYIKEQRANPQVELINTQATTGTAPGNDQTWWLRFADTNGRLMGAIRSAYLKDSTNTAVYMRAIKSGASGDTDFADLSIHYPSTGNPFAEAPSSDRNGSILTTVNKSKSSNGYFQLGNGMIVQWGRVTAGASTTPSITFPKAFTSATSYSFASTPYNASNTNSYTEHLKAYSKTGVTLFCGPGWNPIFWIAIGY